VIADEARADVMIRLVGDSAGTKAALERAVEGRAELREVIEIPAVRLDAVDGIPPRWWRSPPTFRPSTANGAAVPDRAGQHPRRAHPGGARTQTRIDRSCGTLSTNRQTIMQTRIEVGILGATGMVGQNFINFLQGHPLVRPEVAGSQRPLRRQEV
jgi:hypothetical protein